MASQASFSTARALCKKSKSKNYIFSISIWIFSHGRKWRCESLNIWTGRFTCIQIKTRRKSHNSRYMYEIILLFMFSKKNLLLYKFSLLEIIPSVPNQIQELLPFIPVFPLYSLCYLILLYLFFFFCVLYRTQWTWRTIFRFNKIVFFLLSKKTSETYLFSQTRPLKSGLCCNLNIICSNRELKIKAKI